MANRTKIRKSDPKKARVYAVDSATVIEVGDAVYQEINDIRPAGDLTYGASLADAQTQFAKQFVGIAMQASANGETAPITVYGAGEFEFDCAAAQFEIGDAVGMDDNAGGTALIPQQVIAVGENGIGAIARITKRYSANVTRVVAEILPHAGRALTPIPIPLYQGLITAAVDFLTAWPVLFPFKLVRVDAIVTVLTAGACVVTIDKGATSLDDTLTIPTASAVGDVTTATMDDATGDDIFNMGDTLTIKGDGTPTAGEALFVLWVVPFLNES